MFVLIISVFVTIWSNFWAVSPIYPHSLNTTNIPLEGVNSEVESGSQMMQEFIRCDTHSPCLVSGEQFSVHQLYTHFSGALWDWMSALDTVHYGVSHNYKCLSPQIVHYVRVYGSFSPTLDQGSFTSRLPTQLLNSFSCLWPWICVSSILHSCGHCRVIFHRYHVNKCQTKNVSAWLWKKSEIWILARNIQIASTAPPQLLYLFFFFFGLEEWTQKKVTDLKDKSHPYLASHTHQSINI